MIHRLQNKENLEKYRSQKILKKTFDMSNLPFAIFKMLSFSLFCFVSSKNRDEYLYSGLDPGYGIFYSSRNMFNGYSLIKPGLKLTFNDPTGGISSKKTRTYTSEYGASMFLRENLNKDQYELAKKVLKYPKYRKQLITMDSSEVYNGKQYLGRKFEIKATFLSLVRKGTEYHITIVPYTTSILATTFLWHKTQWEKFPKEMEFDYKRANDHGYFLQVYKFLCQKGRVTNAPYPFLGKGEVIEHIYQSLIPSVAAERDKFTALPY